MADRCFSFCEKFMRGRCVSVRVDTHEQNADDLKKLMVENHIKRLHKGVCSPEVGSLYLSLASDCERIADHLTNVANTVKFNA